ncbi:retinol dehydrogenase 14-like [Anneissia japonica]|uniref:retinol dehydrogenase 14-like n=1 Tax=Anneissia japonica TaxID=1529436 RepID=UPI001425B01F|nr:retinol dehydrogenase 14-like [Anneissia japonica]
MNGRIFLVTGATDGIGKHTAMRLANTGATVLIHGRDKHKGEDVLKQIKDESKNNNIRLYISDLSTLDGVRKLAEEVKKSEDHLDVLINNAGVFLKNRTETADGLETTFAVNVVAPFLLTHCLLDLVRAGSKPRIIITSSISQTDTVTLTDLQSHQQYREGHGPYELSKTIDIIMALEMAEKFSDIGITVNTLDPGTVNTKMLYAGWGPIGIPVNKADNTFLLATDDAYANVTGKYFLDNTISNDFSGVCKDSKLRKQIWKALENISGVKY